MSNQNETLINKTKSTTTKLGYDITEVTHLNAAETNSTAESAKSALSYPEPSPNGTFDDHERPTTHLTNEDMSEDEDLTMTPEYLGVKEKLIKERVSKSDIAYLETKLHQLADINFDSAMMRVLQYKIELAHNGTIKNKGIHKTEAPPYAFYDEEEMTLPKTKKFKTKLHEMNKRLYTENRIEWMDYTKLKEDDSVDYRNDQGKFVVAKVMEKDGVELVLYTKEGQTVMINFLDQYPFQRLFKMGAVTARVPKKIRRNSIAIGSQIRLLCDTDFIMDSKWTKMECKVVDRDIDHYEERDGDEECDDIPKQIQIEFTMSDHNGVTNGSGDGGHTNGNGKNGTIRRHRMWVHLDNTQKLEEESEENEEDFNEKEESPFVINGKPPLRGCGCIVM